MAICPTCLTKYPDSVATCSSDGMGLVPEEAFAYVDKDLVAGDLVGEYRIEGKLGEGGFGAVFRAVHPVIGKQAAIKVLSRQFSANPQMVSRFIAEARAVNQIQHRNIIDIFSFGQLADGRQYYVMELLAGATFDSYLASNGRLSLGEALPILRGIARALDAAHAKGILHRDLKPENVYLVFDEDGGVQPKLLDFGLVKLLGAASGGGEHKTKTGTPMGTPYYMSPEQCRGKDVDRGTDIYAFGALVFQVLTGEVPFDGGSPMDVLLKHMTEAPPSASERCAAVPPQLDAPIRRMLAKEVSDRPASVGEALEALVAAGQAAGVLDGAASSLPRPIDRPRVVVGVASAATPAMGGSTFLASSASVAPVRTRAHVGRIAAMVAVASLLIGVGAVAFFVHGQRAPKDPATGIVVPPLSPSVGLPSAVTSAPVTPRSEDVDLRVEGAPKDAKVMDGTKELGLAPGPFTVRAGAPVTFTVVAKGYKPQEVSLTPSTSTTLRVALEKLPPAPPGKSGPRGPGVSPDLEGFDPK